VSRQQQAAADELVRTTSSYVLGSLYGWLAGQAPAVGAGAAVRLRGMMVPLLCCMAAPVAAGVAAAARAREASSSDPNILPINPRLFGFSTYLGPIVNLSYSDPAVLLVAKALRIGSLRYPGGSTANSWNISNGRWVHGAGWDYKARNEALPPGTFTPKAFMAGIGRTLSAAPIWVRCHCVRAVLVLQCGWRCTFILTQARCACFRACLLFLGRDFIRQNLNMVTVPNPPEQLDVLRSMGVPVEYVELGK
jgi:hypothetical protein